MDWNRPGKLIRPNPDWEEDLFLTCEVTPELEARARSYSERYKKKNVQKSCCCQEKSRPGVAPRMKLNSGRTIPCLGIGTWLGEDDEAQPTAVKDRSIQRAVEHAIEEGYRLIDTAPDYNTEEQVGAAIRNKIAKGVVRREDLFVITKLPNTCHGKKAVVPALKRSLYELKLGYVDLYLINWPVGVLPDGSYDDTDHLDTWQGMIEARVEDLTKAIGVANFSQHQLNRIVRLTKMKPAAVMVEINLTVQQASYIQYCKSHDIAVIASAPFGSLFHLRARSDAPPPRTDTQALLKLSDKYHKTVAQVALRYLVELGVIPIPKSIKPARIEANIEVFDFQLTKAEKELLAKYDRNYRTVPVKQWKDAPNYPFK